MHNPESGPRNEPLPELDFDLLNETPDTTGNTEEIDDTFTKVKETEIERINDVPVIRQETPLPKERSKGPRNDRDAHNTLIDQAKKS